jgi:hypothetical protein
MKSILLSFVVTILSVTAFAQGRESVSTTQVGSQDVQRTKGVHAGIVYSNITDASLTASVSNDIGKFEDTSKGGVQLGLMGLNVGYKDKYHFGNVGLDASATILKAINKNEADSKLTVYKIQAGGILPIGDKFSINGGLNVSYFGGIDSPGVKFEPAAGLDLSVQMDINNFGIMIGTQYLGYNAKAQGGGSDLKVTGYVDGVITQVSYMF